MRAVTITEISERFGIHRDTAYRWLREGHIPARQIGRRWIVSRATLEALLLPPASVTGSQSVAVRA